MTQPQTIPTPFEQLSGKECIIEDSYLYRNDNTLLLGDRVGNLGDWGKQAVYRSTSSLQDIVVKILKEKYQNRLIKFLEEEFNEIEFYSSCLEAIETSGVPMPDYWDIVSLKIGTKTGVFAHIQSYIKEDFYDDTKPINLPDLGIIGGHDPIGKARLTSFKECYHIRGTDKIMYGDWKKYLHKLALIAKKRNITTREELKIFQEIIISAM